MYLFVYFSYSSFIYKDLNNLKGCLLIILLNYKLGQVTTAESGNRLN